MDYAPVPSEDIPFVATIAFLKSDQNWETAAADQQTFWERVLSYFENFERAYRQTLYNEVIHHRDEQGNWVCKGKAELEKIQAWLDEWQNEATSLNGKGGDAVSDVSASCEVLSGLFQAKKWDVSVNERIKIVPDELP